MDDNSQTHILLVDDDPSLLKLFAAWLRLDGFHVTLAGTAAEGLELARTGKFDLVVLDVVLPDKDGREVCREIKDDPGTGGAFVLLMSSMHTSSRKQSEGLDLGADGYIAKSVSQQEFLSRVKALLRIKHAENRLREAHDKLEERVLERTAQLQKANDELHREIAIRTQTEQDLQRALKEIGELKERLEQENLFLQEEIRQEHHFGEIIGESKAIVRVLRQIEQVAPSEATVLVLGETGTGKELIARAVHQASPRSGRPLLKVDCASLPSNLMESELFGHEKGAFTDARERQIGRFEIADGTTVFLDEIGELPVEVQAKLLRVLQDGEFERVGSPRTIKVDVRVIAATNKNLQQEIQRGTFRRDLWYRLNVFPVTTPPLRDRKEDIPLLVNAFVSRFAKKLGKQFDSVSARSMASLHAYDWPGNVREMENIIERAVILSQPPELQVETPGGTTSGEPGSRTMEDVERNHITEVLTSLHWKIEGRDGAAEVLGLKPGTLRSRMKKLGIERPSSSPR